jgi:hypothetical protein
LSDLLVEFGNQSFVISFLLMLVTKDTGSTLRHFPLPFVDLTGVYLKSTGYLGYGFLAFKRFKGYLGFEGGTVFPAAFFHILLLLLYVILGAELYLNNLSEFWGPPQNANTN